MGLRLRHLDDDPRTRRYMRSEVEADIAANDLYYGKYLAAPGRDAFPDLLRAAVDQHDDDWLAAQLSKPGHHLDQYSRRKPKGGMTMADVPYTAPQTLAEGEFNRYYVRGLCCRALEDGTAQLRVERVKDVEKPRAESELLRGTLVDAARLLEDLRSRKGMDTALGVPPGPNSGLSVELP